MTQEIEVNVDEKIKGKGHVRGKFLAAVTEATHAYLHTDAMNVQGAHIEYKGREFYASAHVYLRNGAWELERPSGYWGVSEINSYKEATRSQRETVRAAMLAAWADVAATIPEALSAAERDKRRAAVESAEEDVRKAQEALTKAQKALDEARAHEAALV